MRSKETVLVTAAAGGTGQFAVQLAKLAGNTVVATCGSDDKAELLTDLGCDRVINYNKEQPKVLLEGTSTHVLYIHAILPCHVHHCCLAGHMANLKGLYLHLSAGDCEHHPQILSAMRCGMAFH